MHFDALTLACITAELRAATCPGRIQQVLLVDEHSLGLEIYSHGTRHQLLLSAQPAAPRIHTVDYKLRRGVARETPLLLLLRKYARDALLTGIEQPQAYERVVRLHCEHKVHGDTWLVAELLGHQSNLILVDSGGRILECLRRMPDAKGRELLPGRAYAPPPAQDKVSPLDDGSEGYYTRLAAALQQPGPRWRALVNGVAGMSPTAARELDWRAARLDNGEQPIAVFQALQSLWLPVQTGEWQPGLVQEDGNTVGFAPYVVHFRGEFVPTATMSEALARYFAAGESAGQAGQATMTAGVADPYAGQRAAVTTALNQARRNVERRLAALAGDEPAPGEAGRLRSQAQWLLALASQISPGQTILEVDAGDSEPLRIQLDPNLSPIEQAQQMFKRAGKLERAAAFIPQRRAELQTDLAFLEQLALDLGGAQSQPEIAAVEAELRNAGLWPRQKTALTSHTRGQQSGPLRLRSAQGFEILVGRNARQNESVTFKLADTRDLWFHVRGMPGAHVVLRAAGRTPDPATIRVAAQLAAFHSAARGERSADVIVTERRWVGRAPGGKPGQVLVEREEVISVPAAWPNDLTEEDATE